MPSISDTPGAHRSGTGSVAGRIADALGAAGRAVHSPAGTLEVALPGQEVGRALSSPLLIDKVLRAHAVGSPGEPRFGAFVDGVQESRAVAYLGVIPVVHARVAAVVRARVGRRLVTWGDGARVDEAVYLPLGMCDPSAGTSLLSAGLRVIDTTDDAIAGDEVHPQQLLRRALQLVQRQREKLERELAEQWCRAAIRFADAPGASGDGAHAALYVDGGLPSPAVVLASRLAVGVVKSHHTLYTTGGALNTVMSLGAGERSSIFVVKTWWREPVASWYLRLRDPRGRDPLWGLARVEASLPTIEGGPASADDRADEVSRWVLAESAPLSLPDSRWDTMAYGIRDCEVYLRATLGAR